MARNQLAQFGEFSIFVGMNMSRVASDPVGPFTQRDASGGMRNARALCAACRHQRPRFMVALDASSSNVASSAALTRRHSAGGMRLRLSQKRTRSFGRHRDSATA